MPKFAFVPSRNEIFLFAVSQETNSRLLKSLVAILLINIGGYSINLSIYYFLWLITQKAYMSGLLYWELTFINGILLNIASACNAPVLYITGYRNQLYYTLKILF